MDVERDKREREYINDGGSYYWMSIHKQSNLRMEEEEEEEENN